MNDSYRALVREYIRAVNFPGLYTNVEKQVIERQLWEVVSERPGESPYEFRPRERQRSR
jgi:hypothetical protein